jgi:hypothetical protein
MIFNLLTKNTFFGILILTDSVNQFLNAVADIIRGNAVLATLASVESKTARWLI